MWRKLTGGDCLEAPTVDLQFSESDVHKMVVQIVRHLVLIKTMWKTMLLWGCGAIKVSAEFWWKEIAFLKWGSRKDYCAVEKE